MRKEKLNPTCMMCKKECKQPASATMVSCPAFEKSEKTLDMFDSAGNVIPGIAPKRIPSKKKRPQS